MKTSNLSQGPAHREALIRGWVSPYRAGSSGVSVSGGGTDATGIVGIDVVGGTVTDNGDGTITITIDGGSAAVIDPEDFGAVADATGVNDAVVAGGSLSTVTSATAAFTSADTGKRYTLSTTAGTITRGTLTYVSATSCTMSTAAGGAMTGARLIWGTDNSTAIQDALDAAQPGERVELGTGRWFVFGNLDIPEGVHFGPNTHGPYFPDTAIYANTWGCTLVVDHGSDPAILLEQGAGCGDFLMFDAGQVPPTATTPVSRGAFIQVAEDTEAWADRQTRVSGWRIGSPYLCNPYIGLYLRGGGGLVDAPQIGGLYRSVVIDHNYDFISIRRIKCDRLAAASEAPGLGESGLNSWYVENAWALYVYRSDGFKVGEVSTYGFYGGIAMLDSPDGPQDPGSIEYGYGLVGMADIDSCVLGIYVESTNTPGLIVGEFICGPNVLGGTAGSRAVWTNTGGVHAPLVIINSWAVRGSWSVAVADEDAGTLIVPSTNPGSGAGDSEGPVAIRYTYSTTTTNSDPGAGNLRMSSTTLGSVTTVRADLADVEGTDVTTVLDVINDQVGTTKGYLRIQHANDPKAWVLFDVTGFASPSGYRNITVSPRAAGAATTFRDGDPITLTFTPSTVGISAGASFATPAIVLGTAAAAGAASTVIRSDATIVAFDGTTPAAVGTAATGSAAVAARRDHVHATGAGTPSTQAFGDAASTGSGPAAAMTDHKHAMPAAPFVPTITESYLTAGVTMTNANTFYDGPSLSLAAGTYLIVGTLFLTGGANWFTLKVWDGSSSIYGSSAIFNPVNTAGQSVPFTAAAVLGSTTTVKVSAAHNTTGGTINPTPFTDNTGLTNKASVIRALRIA